LGNSNLDTGGLPFGWTHSWIQGDSPLGDSFLDTGGLPPLGDSFLDTGGLPFGGLFPGYRGTPPFGGTLSWIQGDSPPLGNSFLWGGGGSHICLPREDSFLPTKATFFLFLPTEGLLPNLWRTHACPLELSPCQLRERDLFLPHELSSCPLRERLPTEKCLILLPNNSVKENRIKFCFKGR
jgi:hypothetical protein